MSRVSPVALVGALLLVGAAGGCGWLGSDTDPAEPEIVLPPHIQDTIAQQAILVGGSEQAVYGYGIVVGLGDKGSAEVPPQLRERMIKMLTQEKLGLWTENTEMISPERFLRDRDTTVVMVVGAIPPGAPKGTKFDLSVQVLPHTQTLSLDGGLLMPLDLRVAYRGVARPEKDTFPVAEGGGPLFVNPFLDLSDPEDHVEARRARVLNGGTVRKGRALLLQLRQPDYARCSLIERRINERFPGADEWDKVANAKTPGVLELTIPTEYRDDYQHFLDIVMHLPLRTSAAAGETHARRIAEHMQLPDANHHELAMVWEAMGRQVLPIVQRLYESENNRTAYYAARTGLRLGDASALPIVARTARHANSPLRIPAIRELGRHPELIPAGIALRDLIDSQDERVRVAAYEAMLARGDRARIQTFDIGEKFMLDLVASDSRYMIYATQAGRPRLALFGRDMTLDRPLFFTAPDDLLLLSARVGEDKVMCVRKIPRNGAYSDPFYTDFRVCSLVETLGLPAEWNEDNEIQGLALSYSQILSVLYRLCKQGDINAKFVLQEPTEIEMMFDETTTIGRPNMPGG